MQADVLLEIQGLKTSFYQDKKIFRAVDDVDITIHSGEILVVVGESGCGKSVTALSILNLIEGKGRVEAGSIKFQGQELRGLDKNKMRDIRGKEIAMIFQDPMISLSPVYTVGEQIAETIQAHKKISHKKAISQAAELLDKVGIPSPEKRINDYPHQMSGGMRQRVMIAMALCLNPKLLIADEPTTALDVTIQAQILELILALRKQFNMSIMMITHDLGLIAEAADRVTVMYAGKVVESAGVRDLFASPMHPYTLGLMKALPRLDKEVDKLYSIPGIVPSAAELPEGCRYADRCPLKEQDCLEKPPSFTEITPGHMSACLHIERIAEMSFGKTES